MKSQSGWIVSRRAFMGGAGAWGAAAALGLRGARGDGARSSLRFGMITDLHYADSPPRGARHYRDSLAKLEECVALMNEKKPEFLIQLGDFKDQDDKPEEAKTLEYLRTIEKAFAKFSGPRRYVLGNHDLDSISKAQFLAETAMDAPHYSFDAGGVHFAALDANHKADDADYDHGNFNYIECRVPRAQIDWLEKDLAAAPAGAPAIVFVHQRLDGPPNLSVNNAEEVRAAIEKSGKVLAVFQGHDHRGDFKRINGIPYYTLKGAIEGAGPENSAYAIVEVRGDGTIEVEAYRKAVAAKFEPKSA